jgi:hypothetical protein
VEAEPVQSFVKGRPPVCGCGAGALAREVEAEPALSEAEGGFSLAKSPHICPCWQMWVFSQPEKPLLTRLTNSQHTTRNSQRKKPLDNPALPLYSPLWVDIPRWATRAKLSWPELFGPQFFDNSPTVHLARRALGRSTRARAPGAPSYPGFWAGRGVFLPTAQPSPVTGQLLAGNWGLTH